MQLYALCDQDVLDKFNISIEYFVSIANEHDAKIIQYRNKTADIAFIKKQLIKIRKLYNGFLIVNDKYELIEFCDGVHLGQEDLREIDLDIFKAIEKVRDVITKDKILGISTHNEVEILESNKMDLNYIGLGAYRSTSTKNNISVVLGKELDALAFKSKHPVCAIGGVKLSDDFENVTYNVICTGLLK